MSVISGPRLHTGADGDVRQFGPGGIFIVEAVTGHGHWTSGTSPHPFRSGTTPMGKTRASDRAADPLPTLANATG